MPFLSATGVSTALVLVVCLTANLAAAERFILPVPAHLSQARTQTSDDGKPLSRQFMPPGESPAAWSEMLIQQKVVLPAAVPLQAYAEQLSTLYREACEGAGGKLLGEGVERGYPTMYLLFACPHLKQAPETGEVSVYKLIRGQTAVFSAQRAARVAPFPTKTLPVGGARIRRWLVDTEMAVLCNDPLGGEHHPCPQGPDGSTATGPACAFQAMLTVRRTAPSSKAEHVVPVRFKAVPLDQDTEAAAILDAAIAGVDDGTHLRLIASMSGGDNGPAIAAALTRLDVVRQRLIDRGVVEARIGVGYNADCADDEDSRAKSR